MLSTLLFVRQNLWKFQVDVTGEIPDPFLSLFQILISPYRCGDAHDGAFRPAVLNQAPDLHEVIGDFAREGSSSRLVPIQHESPGLIFLNHHPIGLDWLGAGNFYLGRVNRNVVPSIGEMHFRRKQALAVMLAGSITD